MRSEIIESFLAVLTIICIISCKEQPKPNEATATAQVQDPIENSRAFNHDFYKDGGDTLISVDDGSGPMICKATFAENSITTLLASYSDDHWIKIYTHFEGFPGTRNFKIEIYDNTGIRRAVSDWADYPCPKECYPNKITDTSSSSLEGVNNTFDIADIRKVLAFPGCTYINVHRSKWKDGTGEIESLSIYPLTGSDINNATSHHDEPDYSFTSVLEIP